LITYQPTKLHHKLAKGLKCQIILFAVEGNKFSLVNNFTPSAIGCKIPQIPVVVGPNRRCTLANTFRSAKVKKAVAIKTGKTTIKGKIILSIQIKDNFKNKY